MACKVSGIVGTVRLAKFIRVVLGLLIAIMLMTLGVLVQRHHSQDIIGIVLLPVLTAILLSSYNYLTEWIATQR
ncbi:hypothetical protein [Edaphobacter modestus]|nr:hypothetical protein [Edaphobacter modestus]